MGRDIALPGVDLAIELLQQLRADLVASGSFAVETKAVVVKRGRPLKPGSRGWGNLTAEERSAEMKRRMAVSQAKRGKIKIPGLHPRDPKHPGHDAWVAKLRASQKKAWNALSPAKQKAKVRKMRTARDAVNEIQVAS